MARNIEDLPIDKYWNFTYAARKKIFHGIC